jgi:NADH pyrophosphatase NudC (nudix superfamily)
MPEDSLASSSGFPGVKYTFPKIEYRYCPKCGEHQMQVSTCHECGSLYMYCNSCHYHLIPTLKEED